MSISPEGWVCNCWAATLRVISESEAPFRPQSPSSQRLPRSMPLSDVLTLGRNLLQHWELLNGCASSDTHLNPFVFRFIADAIGCILTLHELAIEGLSERDAPESSIWQSPGARPRLNMSGNVMSPIRNTAPTLISNLELDDKEEITIVGREALIHSLMRLGAVL
ncbi:hypothetical protein F4814DRAFT_44970 [Daldinia grandis]|nr:hypothetical protein F4814DRAFT_44970 [Daldinia grandis]